MSSAAIRTVIPSDEPALAVLANRVVDGGAVAFTRRRHVPFLDAEGPESVGFIAETRSGEVVGAAWVRIGRCRLFGSPSAYALLHSLSVAPDARRRGVATALTNARLAWVDAQSDARGEVIVPIATIQHGNTASLANTRRWATVISDELRVTPVPVRRRPPRARPEWRVHDGNDLPAADDAPGLGPDTAPRLLSDWLERSVGGERMNHLHVLTDRSGTVLAALGIHDDTPLSHLQVVRMPASIALANRFVRVVGGDGAMRTGQVTLAWARDQAAGRYLWQHVRWRWHPRLTSLVTTVDPTDPSAAMTKAPRWLPATRIHLAARLPNGQQRLPGPIRLPL